MDKMACRYCGLDAEAHPAEVKSSVFTGEPICAECARIMGIPTEVLTAEDMERLLWDAVLEDSDVRDHQTTAITRIAELLAYQNRRIDELEKKLAAQDDTEK